ncbi:OmpW/AlkL family protein [Solimicrobium silvestre]|uniref:Outer membrane autotransporter barrel domain n=1 Tax=Solimicrobium silvestre TaxID=2099400 RepID=A0A2S9GX39_9BURK|nr:OmpW family outer membrane protein [Solimicrobium silvestre]PRC92226.1 Outer membrane autotransporter barrel domain [Solimicrobium silvestre]
MKKISLVIALAVIGFNSASVMAQESPWLVRARIVDVDTANKSDPIAGVGASNQITVSNKVIPEFDISYFFTPNWATELVLTYPQKHDVYLSGAQIGTVKELPPTLTVQYHFTPESQFSPYLGAGINYTNFSSVELANGAISLDNHSFGLALQAGIDYKLDKNWSLNMDVKYVQMRSDVYLGGSQISNIKIDPWLIGVGVGYRF